MNTREILAAQLATLADPQKKSKLAWLLESPADRYDLVLEPYVDTGVRDEEGVPTEYEDPAVHVNVYVQGKQHGNTTAGMTLSADEAPGVARAVVAAADRAAVSALREVGDQVARFMAVVQQLRNQQSRIQALRQEQP